MGFLCTWLSKRKLQISIGKFDHRLIPNLNTFITIGWPFSRVFFTYLFMYVCYDEFLGGAKIYPLGNA